MATFLDTGIPELNDLLTSSEFEGLAVPGHGRIHSSTFVIKGQAGSGKSVLATIMAHHLHNQVKQIQEKEGSYPLQPFAVYFSFAQSAGELCNYIRKILAVPQPGDQTPPRPDDQTTSRTYDPLIVSPKRTEVISGSDGLAILRRCLLDHLTPLIPYTRSYPLHLDEEWRSQPRSNLLKYVQHFRLHQDWELGPELETDVVPADEQRAGQVLPIIFVDPINCFFDYRDSRSAISMLFETFRTLQWPLVVMLEDAGSAASEQRRQLASDVEFEADVVLNLSRETVPYSRRRMEVTKNRHAPHRHGLQNYRIGDSKHPLSNIESSWSKKHPGIMIFRSTHWLISQSRSGPSLDERYFSGMSHFDHILSDGVLPEGERPLPQDAFILVGGNKGGHKLSLGFNLLVGGLWAPLAENATPKKESKAGAMLLSFGEENGIQVPQIALAYAASQIRHANNNNNADDRNNGEKIVWAPEPKAVGETKGMKVIINEWQSSAKSPALPLIEVTFRPGYLSPEEFLWVVSALTEHYQPYRVLVDNTAHLQMRFPALYREEMLFPALSELAHSKELMLIVNHVTGRGSANRLTYGLEACADYIVEMEVASADEIGRAVNITESDPVTEVIQRPGLTWSTMMVRNVRGKNYQRIPHLVTVTRQGKKNHLYILDMSHKDDTVRSLGESQHG